MWIYEYSKFDHSGFLPAGPYESREEAARAMKDHADRFGAIVQGPREVGSLDDPAALLRTPAGSR